RDPAGQRPSSRGPESPSAGRFPRRTEWPPLSAPLGGCRYGSSSSSIGGREHGLLIATQNPCFPQPFFSLSHHFRLPSIPFKITSCTFIIRSISADETFCPGFTPSGSHPRQADKSRAN